MKRTPPQYGLGMNRVCFIYKYYLTSYAFINSICAYVLGLNMISKFHMQSESVIKIIQVATSNFFFFSQTS